MKDSSFYQEIMEEGRVELGQAHVRETLAFRFGPEEAARFDELVRGITDSKRLDDLFHLALRCRNVSEFRKEVEPKGRSRTQKK